MKLNSLRLIALLCGAPVLAHAGLDIGIGVNLGGPVYVREAPPPPPYERVGPAPYPGYVFIHGHYVWHHGHWEWIGGHWEAPRAGMVWIDGHWDNTPNGYVWVDGHWGAPAVVVAAPPPPPPAPVVEQAPPPAPGAEVVVEQAPPPPMVERIGPPPGPEYFWIGGHWAWQGRWVWIHGRYERHPHFHPGAAWVAGHWDLHHGHYVWVEGYWR